MSKYILNPLYVLRHESNKTYIMMGPAYGISSTLNVIHPVFAMLLSFFNGREFDEIVKSISEYFDLSSEKIVKLMTPLLENSNIISNKYGAFPRNIIIRYKEGVKLHGYKPEDFIYNDVDLRISRFVKPANIVFNVTMKCRTSCIYCYADRKNTHAINHLTIERIEEIIDEAKKIGVIKFKLMGGEVFLHKDWYRILKKLSENEYFPDLSTKVPLKQEHIDAIKEFNVAPIQFSLDTMIKDNLYKILNVKDPYYDEIIETFNLLEKNQIPYSVHTVLSKYNDSFEDIDSLKDFFKNKNNLIGWAFDVAKCSMYLKKEYKDYKITLENFIKLEKYISDIDVSGLFKFNIRLPFARKYKEAYEIEKLKSMYSKRTPCSGNLFAFYILPDGKVTLCEELYWHPSFIIGDLKQQSIMDVWNSKKAHDLFYLQQDAIQKESACCDCDIFSECRKYKHVCWRDIILGYGSENWDYPDLFCFKAPKIKKDIFIYPTP